MKNKKNQAGFSTVAFIIIILVVIVVDVAIAVYYVKTRQDQLEQPTYVEVPEELPKVQLAVADKRLISADDLDLETIKIKPEIPSYDLPLKATDDIDNFQSVADKVKLNQSALSLLEKNGFVVIDTPESIVDTADDFADYYEQLKWKELPVFITSDSLLHYYHIFFDTTLMKLERDLFYNDIWQMSQELYDQAVKQYNSTGGDLQEAAKRNAAYFAVALELLKPQANQVISDKTLREEYCFEGIDEEFCQSIIEGVKSQYGENSSFKYFTKDDIDLYIFTVDNFIGQIVNEELSLIEEHEGWEYSPIFIYQEDYSQYVPRGHYTKSEKLKNYFKALMWYGRMTALLNGTEQIPAGQSKCDGRFTGIVSDYDAKIQTLQANLIATNFLISQNVQNLWQRMYAITAFFAGFSDDLGPYEYGVILKDILGEEIKIEDLETKFSEIKNKLDALSYEPIIYSGLGKCEMIMSCPPLSAEELQSLKGQAKALLSQTKGFRLMGQRFAIDSYFFSEIVSPYSGQYSGEITPLPTADLPFTYLWNDQYEHNRPFTWVKTEVTGCPEGREVKGFPSGLDVMAVFGSDRAKEILDDLGDSQYSDYDMKFNQLKKEIEAMPEEDWYQNLYYNWLYALQGLNAETGKGYQTFMQTDAWQDKELNTALASWAELRHDTILYVKQSYTIAELGGAMVPPVVGYVEPVPEFYVRLLNLTKMTNKGLQRLIPQNQLDNLEIVAALDRFESIINSMLDITKKELANESLTEDEYDFIKNFGQTSKDLIEIVSGGEIDPEILKSVMVADVHTEGNVEKVLEEGVGYIKTLIAAYKLPDDRILIGVGPVFSYYEFKQDMGDRLTDEKWREMLDSYDFPDQPSWVKSFTE